MTDEIKAAAERWKRQECPVVTWEYNHQLHSDVATLADWYVGHLDREAERALPVTAEWLEPLCVSISVARKFWYLEERLHLRHEGDEFWVVLNGQPVKITTRGQVMDLCNLIGFKLGWHLEGKVKS